MKRNIPERWGGEKREKKASVQEGGRRKGDQLNLGEFRMEEEERNLIRVIRPQRGKAFSCPLLKGRPRLGRERRPLKRARDVERSPNCAAYFSAPMLCSNSAHILSSLFSGCTYPIGELSGVSGIEGGILEFLQA